MKGKRIFKAIAVVCLSIIAMTMTVLGGCSIVEKLIDAGTSTGTIWHSGNGNDMNQIVAHDGDFYFDEDDGKIYKLFGEEWKLVSTIKGEDGNVGVDGKGVANVVIEYEEVDGVLKAVLVFTFTDGSTNRVVTDIPNEEPITTEALLVNAIAAADNGANINIAADIALTETNSFTIDKYVTIWLNGYTVTAPAVAPISEEPTTALFNVVAGGSLTVYGDGTVNSVNDTIVANGGSVVIMGGNFVSANGKAISSTLGGDATIYAGNFSSDPSEFLAGGYATQLVDGKYVVEYPMYSSINEMLKDKGVANILGENDSLVNSNGSTEIVVEYDGIINGDGTAKIIFNNGVTNGLYYEDYKGKALTISNIILEALGNTNVIVTNSVLYLEDVIATSELGYVLALTAGANVTISGGTYTGDIDATNGSLTITGGTFDGEILGSPIVTGGTFKNYVDILDGDDRILFYNDGWYTVTTIADITIDNNKMLVKKDGYYEIEDANGLSNSTIETVNQTTFVGGATIDSMNLTVNQMTANNWYGIRMNDGTYTISNSTIVNHAADYAIGTGTGATATIKNVDVITSKGVGVYATGSGNPSNLTIENVTVNKEGLAGDTHWINTAVAAAYGATLTINGADTVVNGAEYGVFVYTSGGTIIINDGTFKAPTVLIAQKWDYNGALSKIIVNGGNFDGKVRPDWPQAATIEINGGNFTNFGVVCGNPVIRGGTFDADPTAYITSDSYVINNGNGTWTVLSKTIRTVEELATFRDLVNSGKDYAGMTIKLGADIYLNGDSSTNWADWINSDLTSANTWTPIGLGEKNTKFLGTFDGQDYTIYGLYVNRTAITPAYEASGLFGTIGDGTVVKNINVVGAVIDGLTTGAATTNGHAVIAGSIYWNGTVDNASVNYAIVKANRYIGGIVGYAEGNIKNSTVENVTLIGTPDNLTGSYDNGDKVGGIVGYISNAQYVVDNNTVKNATIAGYRDIGGIAGCVNSITINNNVVENVDLIIDRTGNTYGEKDQNAGIFFKRGTGVVANTNTSSDVTITYKGDQIIKISEYSLPLYLGEGNYTLANDVFGTRPLEFIGAESDKSKVVIDIAGMTPATTSITFRNLTVSKSMTEAYTGMQHSEVEAYYDCIINGQFFLYANTVTFERCTFNQTDVWNYSIWTYAAGTVNVTDCTFYSLGRSFLVYSDGPTVQNVNITNTKFINNGAPVNGKAAIEIDSSLATLYTVNITNTTSTGFGSGSVSGNTLWNNKSGFKATVIVDGEYVLVATGSKVYELDAQWAYNGKTAQSLPNGTKVTFTNPDPMLNVVTATVNNGKITATLCYGDDVAPYVVTVAGIDNYDALTFNTNDEATNFVVTFSQITTVTIDVSATVITDAYNYDLNGTVLTFTRNDETYPLTVAGNKVTLEYIRSPYDTTVFAVSATGLDAATIDVASATSLALTVTKADAIVTIEYLWKYADGEFVHIPEGATVEFAGEYQDVSQVVGADGKAAATFVRNSLVAQDFVVTISYNGKTVEVGYTIPAGLTDIDDAIELIFETTYSVEIDVISTLDGNNFAVANGTVITLTRNGVPYPLTVVDGKTTLTYVPSTFDANLFEVFADGYVDTTIDVESSTSIELFIDAAEETFEVVMGWDYPTSGSVYALAGSEKAIPTGKDVKFANAYDEVTVQTSANGIVTVTLYKGLLIPEYKVTIAELAGIELEFDTNAADVAEKIVATVTTTKDISVDLGSLNGSEATLTGANQSNIVEIVGGVINTTVYVCPFDSTEFTLSIEGYEEIVIEVENVESGDEIEVPSVSEKTTNIIYSSDAAYVITGPSIVSYFDNVKFKVDVQDTLTTDVDTYYTITKVTANGVELIAVDGEYSIGYAETDITINVEYSTVKYYNVVLTLDDATVASAKLVGVNTYNVALTNGTGSVKVLPGEYTVVVDGYFVYGGATAIVTDAAIEVLSEVKVKMFDTTGTTFVHTYSKEDGYSVTRTSGSRQFLKLAKEGIVGFSFKFELDQGANGAYPIVYVTNEDGISASFQLCVNSSSVLSIKAGIHDGTNNGLLGKDLIIVGECKTGKFSADVEFFAVGTKLVISFTNVISNGVASSDVVFVHDSSSNNAEFTGLSWGVTAKFDNPNITGIMIAHDNNGGWIIKNIELMTVVPSAEVIITPAEKVEATASANIVAFSNSTTITVTPDNKYVIVTAIVINGVANVPNYVDGKYTITWTNNDIELRTVNVTLEVIEKIPQEYTLDVLYRTAQETVSYAINGRKVIFSGADMTREAIVTDGKVTVELLEGEYTVSLENGATLTFTATENVADAATSLSFVAPAVTVLGYTAKSDNTDGSYNFKPLYMEDLIEVAKGTNVAGTVVTFDYSLTVKGTYNWDEGQGIKIFTANSPATKIRFKFAIHSNSKLYIQQQGASLKSEEIAISGAVSNAKVVISVSEDGKTLNLSLTYNGKTVTLSWSDGSAITTLQIGAAMGMDNVSSVSMNNIRVSDINSVSNVVYTEGSEYSYVANPSTVAYGETVAFTVKPNADVVENGLTYSYVINGATVNGKAVTGVENEDGSITYSITNNAQYGSTINVAIDASKVEKINTYTIDVLYRTAQETVSYPINGRKITFVGPMTKEVVIADGKAVVDLAPGDYTVTLGNGATLTFVAGEEFTGSLSFVGNVAVKDGNTVVKTDNEDGSFNITSTANPHVITLAQGTNLAGTAVYFDYNIALDAGASTEGQGIRLFTANKPTSHQRFNLLNDQRAAYKTLCIKDQNTGVDGDYITGVNGAVVGAKVTIVISEDGKTINITMSYNGQTITRSWTDGSLITKLQIGGAFGTPNSNHTYSMNNIRVTDTKSVSNVVYAESVEYAYTTENPSTVAYGETVSFTVKPNADVVEEGITYSYVVNGATVNGKAVAGVTNEDGSTTFTFTNNGQYGSTVNVAIDASKVEKLNKYTIDVLYRTAQETVSYPINGRTITFAGPITKEVVIADGKAIVDLTPGEYTAKLANGLTLTFVAGEEFTGSLSFVANGFSAADLAKMTAGDQEGTYKFSQKAFDNVVTVAQSANLGGTVVTFDYSFEPTAVGNNDGQGIKLFTVNKPNAADKQRFNLFRNGSDNTFFIKNQNTGDVGEKITNVPAKIVDAKVTLVVSEDGKTLTITVEYIGQKITRTWTDGSVITTLQIGAAFGVDYTKTYSMNNIRVSDTKSISNVTYTSNDELYTITVAPATVAYGSTQSIVIVPQEKVTIDAVKANGIALPVELGEDGNYTATLTNNGQYGSEIALTVEATKIETVAVSAKVYLASYEGNEIVKDLSKLTIDGEGLTNATVAEDGTISLALKNGAYEIAYVDGGYTVATLTVEGETNVVLYLNKIIFNAGNNFEISYDYNSEDGVSLTKTSKDREEVTLKEETDLIGFSFTYELEGNSNTKTYPYVYVMDENGYSFGYQFCVWTGVFYIKPAVSNTTVNGVQNSGTKIGECKTGKFSADVKFYASGTILVLEFTNVISNGTAIADYTHYVDFSANGPLTGVSSTAGVVYERFSGTVKGIKVAHNNDGEANEATYWAFKNIEFIKENPLTPAQIVVTSSENAEVSTSANTVMLGTSVTITVTPNANATVTAVVVNGVEHLVSTGKGEVVEYTLFNDKMVDKYEVSAIIAVDYATLTINVADGKIYGATGIEDICMAGKTLTLKGEVEKTATIGADGTVVFTDLPYGEYTVSIDNYTVTSGTILCNELEVVATVTSTYNLLSGGTAANQDLSNLYTTGVLNYNGNGGSQTINTTDIGKIIYAEMVVEHTVTVSKTSGDTTGAIFGYYDVNGGVGNTGVNVLFSESSLEWRLRVHNDKSGNSEWVAQNLPSLANANPLKVIIAQAHVGTQVYAYVLDADTREILSSYKLAKLSNGTGIFRLATWFGEGTTTLSGIKLSTTLPESIINLVEDETYTISSDKQKVALGSTATVTITPNDGYKVTHVTVVGGTYTEAINEDGSRVLTVKSTSIDKAITISAETEVLTKVYTVNYTLKNDGETNPVDFGTYLKKGTAVEIYAGNELYASAVVGENGLITAELEAGDYTVKISKYSSFTFSVVDEAITGEQALMYSLFQDSALNNALANGQDYYLDKGTGSVVYKPFTDTNLVYVEMTVSTDAFTSGKDLGGQTIQATFSKYAPQYASDGTQSNGTITAWGTQQDSSNNVRYRWGNNMGNWAGGNLKNISQATLDNYLDAEKGIKIALVIINGTLTGWLDNGAGKLVLVDYCAEGIASHIHRLAANWNGYIKDMVVATDINCDYVQNAIKGSDTVSFERNASVVSGNNTDGYSFAFSTSLAQTAALNFDADSVIRFKFTYDSTSTAQYFPQFHYGAKYVNRYMQICIWNGALNLKWQNANNVGTSSSYAAQNKSMADGGTTVYFEIKNNANGWLSISVYTSADYSASSRVITYTPAEVAESTGYKDLQFTFKYYKMEALRYVGFVGNGSADKYTITNFTISL